jgi:hypothetical protein
MNILKEIQENNILLIKNINILLHDSNNELLKKYIPKDIPSKVINDPIQNLNEILKYITDIYNLLEYIYENNIEIDTLDFDNIIDKLHNEELINKNKIIENNNIIKKQIPKILDTTFDFYNDHVEELFYIILKNIINEMKYYDKVALLNLLNEHILNVQQIKISNTIPAIQRMLPCAPMQFSTDDLKDSPIYDISNKKINDDSTFFIEYNINKLLNPTDPNNTWNSGLNDSILDQYNNIGQELISKKHDIKKTEKCNTDTCISKTMYVKIRDNTVKKYNLYGKSTYPFGGITPIMHTYSNDLNKLILDQITYDPDPMPPITEPETTLDKLGIYEKLYNDMKLLLSKSENLPLNYNEFLEQCSDQQKIKLQIEPVIYNIYDSYIKNYLSSIKLKYRKIIESEIPLAVMESVNDISYHIHKKIIANLNKFILQNTFKTGESERKKILLIAYEEILNSVLKTIKFSVNEKLVLLKNNYVKL